MLQKVKERLMMWGYSFTVPEEPETPAPAADPEETEELDPVEESTEETEPEAAGEADPEEPAEETPTADELQILFLIAKTEAHIKNYCNIQEVPEELEYSMIDMVAIEFLKDKAMAGQLDTSSLQIENITSITEGDVAVSFASGSSITLPVIYGSISSKFEADLLPFRRMRW